MPAVTGQTHALSVVSSVSLLNAMSPCGESTNAKVRLKLYDSFAPALIAKYV
jgi:hypothetical protein